MLCLTKVSRAFVVKYESHLVPFVLDGEEDASRGVKLLSPAWDTLNQEAYWLPWPFSLLVLPYLRQPSDHTLFGRNSAGHPLPYASFHPHTSHIRKHRMTDLHYAICPQLEGSPLCFLMHPNHLERELACSGHSVSTCRGSPHEDQ